MYVCDEYNLFHLERVRGSLITFYCSGLNQGNTMFLGSLKQINQSNVFMKPFLHQPMSQSAIQKSRLKPQTVSNADVEAWIPIGRRHTTGGKM